MNVTEETIWNEITDRAKVKCDYATFESQFSKLGEERMAETLLFMIIVGFASGKTKEAIASECRGELLLLGLGLDERSFEEFLKLKDQELATEIESVRFAQSMLDQGMPAGAVREAVLQMFT
jgi:hypothetical protein